MKRVHDSANTIALARQIERRFSVLFGAVMRTLCARGRFRPRASCFSYTAGSAAVSATGSVAAPPSFG